MPAGRRRGLVGGGINATRARGWALVAGQFALLASLVALPAGHGWRVPGVVRAAGQGLRWLGAAAIVLAGLRLGRAISVHPAPSATAVLRTTGAYRYVRHPIYAGVLVLAAGITITSGNPISVAVFTALAALLSVKARFEERLLAERFAGYQAYTTVTRRFVPLPRRHRRDLS